MLVSEVLPALPLVIDWDGNDGVGIDVVLVRWSAISCGDDKLDVAVGDEGVVLGLFTCS